MPYLPSSPLARLTLATAVASAVFAAPAPAADPEGHAFDARPTAAPTAAPARGELRDDLGRFGLVATDPHTRTLRAVGRLNGYLTGPSGEDGARVALGYLAAHGRALGLRDGEADGLRLARRSFAAGLEHLTWRQAHRGIPSSDTSLSAVVTGAGRLVSLTGAPADELAPESVDPELDAGAAYAALTGVAAPVTEERAGGAQRRTTFAGGGTASLALYQAGGGTRLAWRVLAPLSDTEVYDALVDATDGTVVKRANRVKFAATSAKVITSNPDDTSTQANPDFAPWLAGTTTAGGLRGPYAHAFADPNDVVNYGAPLTAPGETTIWTNPLVKFPACGARCTWNPAVPTSWMTNKDQSATQLFYQVNRFRDHLAADPIDFVDGAFGGGDAVIAQAMDGAAINDVAHRNNASFLTLPDGQPGLMEVNLFSNGLDGANDASLVFHEYTHGLTDRLVTDAQGFGALNTAQAGAIAEGLSDFYAMDFLVGEGLEPIPSSGFVRFAEYLGQGLRMAALDDPDEAFSYENFGHFPGGPEVHRDGEIMAQTLWSLRTALIGQYGEDPGVERTRRLVTDALRLYTPPEPSFLDLRNAILLASTADDDTIWDVFTERGMGYFAFTDGSEDVEPVARFEHPSGLEGDELLTGVVRDEDGVPVAGARVAVAGHDAEGLGPQLADDTDAEGRYEIAGPEGVHPLLRARKAAYLEGRETDVAFPGARDLSVARDWASASGGARVVSFTGEDNSPLGCGPGGLIDDTSTTVWSTTVGGHEIIIDLGAPVDVASVIVDPAAGCNDDDTAALGAYELQVATTPGAFAPLASGTITQSAAPHTAFAGRRDSVRFVKLLAKAPQSSTPGTSGASFVDVAELDIVKVPGSGLGPTVETGAATGVGATTATLNAILTPNGAAPDVVFEYGTTPAYGTLVGAGGTQAVLSGLQPTTRYHFRAIALRDGRRYEGGAASFVTGAAAPPVTLPPVVKASGSPARLESRKLTADRRGRFKVRVRFAAHAPGGDARLTVRAGRRAIAVAKVKVVRGASRIVTLRLTATGRRTIRAGRTRSVALELRLPGGTKITRTARLVRRR